MTVCPRTSFLLILLFLLLPVALPGQDCPTVAEALKILHKAEDEGAALHARIEAGCPGHLDTLSLLYHKRTVYAFSAGQPWATTIAFAFKTLAIQRELYAEQEEEPLGKTLANLGVAYIRSGQPQRALPYMKEADAVFKKLEDRLVGEPKDLARIKIRRHRNHEQQVLVWHAVGDYGQAENLLGLMLERAREHGPSNSLAEILRLHGVQANGTDAHADALPWLEEAINMYMETGGIRGEVESRLELARSLYHLARYDEAERAARSAVAVAADYDLFYDKAVLQNQLAIIHLEREAFVDARSEIARGLEIIEGQDMLRLEALLVGSMANVASAEGKHQEAIELAADALALLVPGWSYSEETSVPTREQLAATTYKLDVFEQLGEYIGYFEDQGAAAGAMEVVKAADEVADLLRSDFSGQLSKLFWRREAMPVYEAGIRLSLEAGNAESAFYFLEKSRAILLLESLYETSAHANIDPELSGELNRVNEQLLETRRKVLINEATSGDRQRLIGLNDTLNLLREELASRYPAIGALLRSPDIISIDQARANLAAGGWDRQIHYFLGEDRKYAFELTPTTARTVDLGQGDSLETHVRQLLTYFTAPTAIDNDPAGFFKASHLVYQHLFAPLDAKPGERLLVLPDGLLAYLPFNALVTTSGAKDLATSPYLIRSNELSYAQSATVLARQMAAEGATKETAFTFSPFTEALPGTTAPALPFSKVEVEALAGYYTTTGVEGAAADRSALLTGLSNQSIIHLSTHAYATPNGLEQPRILTATDPVYSPDIQALELKADLVTLSACQSNIGPLAKGEGVLGLGRAFTAAGARGVVASLWSLNDRAATDVVTAFYGGLASGMTKPEALHQAQLSYLDRADVPAYLKSPYYWAGLVYYGDGGALSAGDWDWLLLGGLGLLAGLLLGWWRRSASR